MANRALRTGLVSGLLLLVSEMAFCVSGAQITITIHNEAPIPQKVLEQATQEASRIFHQAGVNSVWILCQQSNAGPSTPPDCRAPVDLIHLSLRIVPWSSQMGDSTFGVAFLSEKGLGTYSDVFYPLAEKLSRQCAASLGRVLGHVMAHEIGHLFLGTNAHSPVGIMRPQWQAEELQQIGMGTLLFTPEQARKMHARLLTPSTDRRAGDTSAPRSGN